MPEDDGGVCGMRVEIGGGYARTLAKILVDPMLGAGVLGFAPKIGW